MEPKEPTSITLEILKKIHHEIGELRDDVRGNTKRFDGVERRLDGIDGRLGGIDGRLDGIGGRLDGIDGRLDGIDGRLSAQGRRLTALETRMHGLVQVNTLSITRQLDLGQRVDAIEHRVAALEAR